jgi:hypothetical protein
MNDIETKRHVARWITRLSAITRQGGGDLDAQTVRDLAEMLADDFPAGAFTTESLQAVAREHEWFPAYAVIRAVVGQWWAENRPAVPAIEGPGGLAAADRTWVAYWHKRQAEDFSGSSAARVLSLIRSQSQAAYDVITSGRDDNVVPMWATNRRAAATRADGPRVSAGAAAGRPW